jgi:indoleacetamide hydrolase
MQIADFPITALRELLDSRAISSLELVEHCIARTEAAKSLNAYASFDSEGLRAQARQADSRIELGERLPLLGIPVALKDNIDAVGYPCAAGTRALQGQTPKEDAVLVRHLRQAGALISGKVHMHELALGITSNNRLSGAVRNPWNPNRIPGGSSGGSGAVVAARLVPAAIGTDTGGSVRVPAALCGVAGLRPTVGRVSGRGIAPISSTRDTGGPLARTIRDCALLDAVLTGNSAPLGIVRLEGLRLGVPRSPFWADLEPDVRNVAESALTALRRAGAQLVEMELPGVAEASVEAGFPMALYEFVREMEHYLVTTERHVTLEELIAGVANPDVAGAVGTLLSGGGIPEGAYQSARGARDRMRALYETAFTDHNVQALIFPTTPRTAALIGEDETVVLNGRDVGTFATFIRNTDPGSNAGIPGISLPAGLASGLPVGIALDGPEGTDRRLLGIAAAIEAMLPPAPLAPLSFA